MTDKRKRRPRRKIKYFRIFLSIILLFLIVFAFLRLPIFNVREITVEGNDKIDSQVIISYSKLSPKDNLIFLNKDKVVENLLENPFIEEASIKKSLLNGVTIQVKESQPAAILQLADKYLILDRFGIIIDEGSSLMLNLSLVKGIKIDGQINFGQPIFSYASKEKNNLLEELFNGENIYKFKSVILEEDQAQLVLKNEVIVAFGSYSKVDYKLKVLDLMIKNIEEDGSKNPSMILMEDGPVPILVVD
ncbi:MAG: FtsQ-type POTRA domain-containing protein [Bacillota bacterium]|nr:FtsQ-type POTRA domain-containing protein [Bacillota bacterium]